MGSGGKFIADKVPVGNIVVIYAAIGNLDEATRKVGELIDRIGADPNDKEAWKELEIYSDRVKLRGMTLVQSVKALIRSQKG